MLAAQPINDNQFSVIGSVLMLMALSQAYRGYVFSFVGDELCYYLGSRFYSPRLGRFLNADKHFDTGTGVIGTNMFAYCNNNPVVNIDPTGEVASTLKLISSITSVLSKIKNLLKNITNKNGYTTPIYNELYSKPWNRLLFNCYSYVLSEQRTFHPGDLSFGYFDGTIEVMNDACLQDLIALGYNCKNVITIICQNKMKK